MSEDVTPDEFGRLRVTDEDTGHERSIQASELPHGNYQVLTGKEHPASDPLTGEALPPVLADSRASDAESEPEGGQAGLYDAQTVPWLRGEVARRNADRDPEGDRFIKPDEPGNKAELIAALEADDEKED